MAITSTMNRNINLTKLVEAIILLCLMIVLTRLALGNTIPPIVAQNSTSPNLTGTTWRGVIEFRQSELDFNRTEFTYLFENDRNVREHYHYVLAGEERTRRRNSATGEYEIDFVFNPKKFDLEGEEVCTYTKENTTLRIECAGVTVNAVIASNRMEGEISLKTIGKTTKWVVQRVDRESETASTPIAEDAGNSNAHPKAKGIDYGEAYLDTQAFYDKGEVLRKHRQFREAIGQYTKAIDRDPWNLRAYVDIGDCKLELHDNRGAIGDYDHFFKLIDALPREVLDQFAELKSLVKHTYHSRGIAKERIKDAAGACEDFRTGCQFGDRDACLDAKRLCN